jgi:hypothetical protein
VTQAPKGRIADWLKFKNQWLLLCGSRKRVEGGDVRLFLLLFIVAVTLCACQNPGRFQAPQTDAVHFSIGAMDALGC